MAVLSNAGTTSGVAPATTPQSPVVDLAAGFARTTGQIACITFQVINTPGGVVKIPVSGGK